MKVYFKNMKEYYHNEHNYTFMSNILKIMLKGPILLESNVFADLNALCTYH